MSVWGCFLLVGGAWPGVARRPPGAPDPHQAPSRPWWPRALLAGALAVVALLAVFGGADAVTLAISIAVVAVVFGVPELILIVIEARRRRKRQTQP